MDKPILYMLSGCFHPLFLRTIYRSLQDLNRQPCMAALLSAIARAHSLLISASPDLTAHPLPSWLSNVLTVLKDHKAPANVRLFLCQALLNEPASAAAAPWAHKVTITPFLKIRDK